jgi:hypothetical protein
MQAADGATKAHGTQATAGLSGRDRRRIKRW